MADLTSTRANAFGAAGSQGIVGGPLHATGSTITGTDGPDTITGTDDDDIIHGLGGNDVLFGLAGADQIDGGNGSDSLYGGAGDDTLAGGEGNDEFIGGEGVDQMIGGPGQDVYFLDRQEDVVVENVGEHYDQIYIQGNYNSASYILDAAAEVERIVLQNSGIFEVTGNEFDQTILANDQANVLRGEGGDDRLFGYDGDDRVYGGNGNDTVAGVGGSDLLYGDSGDDNLQGGDGDDTLIGGSGADTSEGGGGSDHHHVDDAADIVIEYLEDPAQPRTRDVVFASVSYALTANSNVEVLSTSDWSNLQSIDLTGNELGQEIYGNDGANILQGGGGADSLWGLGGNDTYFVDGDDDQVFEADAGFGDVSGGNRDAVFASGSFTLAEGSQVELLSTSAWASTSAINLTGNEFVQEVYGNAGSNVLNGGGAADYMVGFGGNDTYYVDHGGDAVVEEISQGSRDIVFASINYSLAPDAYVEILSTENWSDTVAINLAGNDFAQEIYGNAGANTLDGGGGADRLYGFGGNDHLNGGWGGDVLNGGAGADIFAFSTVEKLDVIQDFVSGFDRIDLGDIISSQNFHFIGSNAFTGVAGETRFADGQVQLDGNGDGVADFVVTVQGGAVTAADFMFG